MRMLAQSWNPRHLYTGLLSANTNTTFFTNSESVEAGPLREHAQGFKWILWLQMTIGDQAGQLCSQTPWLLPQLIIAVPFSKVTGGPVNFIKVSLAAL